MLNPTKLTRYVIMAYRGWILLPDADSAIVKAWGNLPRHEFQRRMLTAPDKLDVHISSTKSLEWKLKLQLIKAELLDLIKAQLTRQQTRRAK